MTGPAHAPFVGLVTGLRAEARRLPRDARLRVAVADADPAAAYRQASALASQGAAVLVSVGVAAGLDPSLRPGTVVVGAGAAEAGGPFLACDTATASRLRRRLPEAVGGDLVTVMQPVTSPSGKHALGSATGAVAADMESAAVLAAAERAGVPAAIVRVILDPADRPLPPAALAGGAGAGGAGAVLAALARRPGDLPALLALARDYARAMAALRRAARALPGLAVPDDEVGGRA